MASDAYLPPEPVWRDTQFRVEMTAGCRDCDQIPKVDRAGQIIEDNGERIQLMHNGVKVKAGGYYGDWMSEVIARLRGHHEPQEELLFHEVLKHVPARASMLELGGFWSYYSLWFLEQNAELRTSVVVEPDPSHLAVGQTNARLNGRHINFVQGSVGATSLSEVNFESESNGLIRIRQFSVPDLIARFGLRFLDVLHCDVQGAETDVLQSCQQLLAEQRIRFCIVSTHVHHISGDPLTHQRCLALIKGAGGKVLAEHDVYESFSGDGLIVAYFGKDALSWPMLNLSYNRYSTGLFRNPLYDLDELNKKLSVTK